MKKATENTKKNSTKTAKKDVPCAKIKRNKRGQIEHTKYILFDGTVDEYEGKHRAFFVCTYQPLEEVDAIVFSGAKTYAFITHDKDDKKEHNHFIVVYENAVSCKRFLTKFDIGTLQTYVTVCHNAKLCFDYMLHRDKKSIDLGKHRYEASEVLSEDINYFDRFKGNDKEANRAKTEKDNAKFLEDMLDKNLTYREKAIRYGRDYMKNFRAYEAFAYVVAEEENKQYCEAQEVLKIRRQRIDMLVERAKSTCTLYGLEFTQNMREIVTARAIKDTMDIELLCDFVAMDIESGEVR